MLTPQEGGKAMTTPTPIRDKLNINPEEGQIGMGTPAALKMYQNQVIHSFTK